MTNRLWRTAIDRAGALASPLAFDELPDAELLRRFIADRDESSFAALVRRHGPLVWSVCRSLLYSEADAEDAFQATFLVLVRSAKRIAKPNALGAWLHTVAGRVCRNSLRSHTRRKKHERNAAVEDGECPVEAAAWERWQSIAHEEISKLPESLRVPFVLCVLQGVRQPEAATQLGWKLGTVSGRVCKAKQALTDALQRRGIAAGILVGLGSAVMPIEAALNTKGFHMLRAGFGPDGGCSMIIHELAKGAMGGFMTKTKLLATAIVVGVLSIGVGTKVISQADAQQGAPPGIPGGPGVGGPGAPPPAPPAPPPPPGGGGGAFNPVGGGMGGFGMLPNPKVEYTFLPRIASSEEFKKTLSKRGEDGWEFVGVVPGSDEIILKRMARTATAGGGGFGSMAPSPGGMSGMPGGSGGRFFPGSGAPAPGGAGAGGGSLPRSGVGGSGGAGSGPGGLGLGGPVEPGSGGLSRGGSSLGPASGASDTIDLKIGETIRHRVSARQSIDRILSQDTKVVEVSADPTDATKVLIKGIGTGTAKVELTDAVGTNVKLTIKVK